MSEPIRKIDALRSSILSAAVVAQRANSTLSELANVGVMLAVFVIDQCKPALSASARMAWRAVRFELVQPRGHN